MVLRADHQVAPTRSTPAPAPSTPTQNRHFEPPTLLQRSAQRWSESRALRVAGGCLRPPCPDNPEPLLAIGSVALPGRVPARTPRPTRRSSDAVRPAQPLAKGLSGASGCVPWGRGRVLL